MSWRNQQFPTWRKLMLSGAVLLLIVSILQATRTIGDDMPSRIVMGIGYGCLAAGFALAMRERRRLKDAARDRDLGEPTSPTDDENSPPPTGGV